MGQKRASLTRDEICAFYCLICSPLFVLPNLARNNQRKHRPLSEFEPQLEQQHHCWYRRIHLWSVESFSCAKLCDCGRSLSRVCSRHRLNRRTLNQLIELEVATRIFISEEANSRAECKFVSASQNLHLAADKISACWLLSPPAQPKPMTIGGCSDSRAAFLVRLSACPSNCAARKPAISRSFMLQQADRLRVTTRVEFPAITLRVSMRASPASCWRAELAAAAHLPASSLVDWLNPASVAARLARQQR